MDDDRTDVEEGALSDVESSCEDSCCRHDRLAHLLVDLEAHRCFPTDALTEPCHLDAVPTPQTVIEMRGQHVETIDFETH